MGNKFNYNKLYYKLVKRIMLNKRNLAIVVVLVLVVAGAVFWVKKTDKGNSGYSVVYLRTGEVYVGKLSLFPDLQLKDSYILQLNKDPKDETKSNFQLQPIAEALWAPKVLHLVKDNVVFYGPVLSTSKIGEALAGKGK